MPFATYCTATHFRSRTEHSGNRQADVYCKGRRSWYSGSGPPQANLICFASLAIPCDLASSHRMEGVFMACRTRTKAAVTALIGARIDVEHAGVGEVLA
jgi:hypothetical protein